MPASDVEVAQALADALEDRSLMATERRALAADLRDVVARLGPQELPRDRALSKRMLAAADVLNDR